MQWNGVKYKKPSEAVQEVYPSFSEPCTLPAYVKDEEK